MKIELLPRPMIRYIESMKKRDLVGAEIGVLNGENAANIFQTLNMKKMFLIDPYKVHDEYPEIKAPVFNTIRAKAEKSLEPFKNLCVWIRKKSTDAIIDVPDNLDFVYVDGNHTYKVVKQDLINYWPKVKKGGVFGGHDYYNQDYKREVKKAVDEFAEKNKLKVFSAVGNGLCDWWVVKND